MSLGQQVFVGYLLFSVFLGSILWAFRSSRGGLIDDARGMIGLLGYWFVTAGTIFILSFIGYFCLVVWAILGTIGAAE
jgi:hypothetical protein